MDIEIAGGGSGGGGRPPTREIGPPAFLTKTYSIVDDPETNLIISWGEFGDTLVIWDHLKFSAEIIPKYFRHNNLSSFVYQLNNYGFRKLGGDHQWEFVHPYFQQGKIHLLENIKRRAQNPEYKPRQACSKRPLSEILRSEMNESKLEIKRLKREQQEMEFHIMALEEDMKNVEKKTKEMILFWSKAFDEMIMREEKNNDHIEARKKIKLDGKKDDEKEIVKDHAIIPISSNQNQVQVSSSTNDINYENTPDKNMDSYTFWKMILIDDDDDDDEGEEGGEMASKQAEIVLDLEHLIEKMEDRGDNWNSTTI